MIVSDWQKAAALLKEKGYVVNLTEVLAVEVPDQPGGLVHLLETIENSPVEHRVHVRLHLPPGGTERCSCSALTIPTRPWRGFRPPAST